MALIQLILLSFLAAIANSQLIQVLGGTEQNEYCSEWTGWTRCVWLQGPRREPNHPWNQPYFKQWPSACQDHQFYKTAVKTLGDSADNVMEYFRAMTWDTEPCGMCSYQQSCGKKCQPGAGLEIAERLCPSEMLNKPQDAACQSVPNLAPNDCKIWPTDKVQFPGVPGELVTFFKQGRWLNCRSERNLFGNICRCCCWPYAPNPQTNKCEKSEDENGGISLPLSAFGKK